MKRLVAIFGIYCIFFINGTQAAESPTIPSQVATCTPCHAETGNSTVPEWPKIAGQHANYLPAQLKAFKQGENGGRVNASMNATVSALSEEDMLALSKFYEAQTISSESTPKEYIDLGQQIYRAGDASKHLASCIGCHGPRGLGNKLASIPSIRAQHAAYTILQLKAYRDKSRLSTNNGMMNDIAAKMSDDEITAVAHYLAGLH